MLLKLIETAMQEVVLLHGFFLKIYAICALMRRKSLESIHVLRRYSILYFWIHNTRNSRAT